MLPGAAVRCGGRILPALAGIHSGAERGHIIPAQAIPGFLLIPGAGRLTTTAAGVSVRVSAGVGGQAAPGWDWQIIRSFPRLPARTPLPPIALARRSVRRPPLNRRWCQSTLRRFPHRVWALRTPLCFAIIQPGWG